MTEPVWVLRETVLALHQRLLSEFGGAGGVRDIGLLDSALARPRQRLSYNKPDVFEMAAACADGLLRNHPFVDGNKRVAFVTAVVFLQVNGCFFSGAEAEATLKTFALAARELTGEDYAVWLRENSKPTGRA